MDSRKTVVVLVLLLAALAAVLLWVRPAVEKARAPVPLAALVGVEAEGSGVAEVGQLRLPAGTPFRLHAVLELKRRDGSRVFMTNARRLRLAGRELEPAELVGWALPQRLRFLWFTVEGTVPYLKLGPDRGLDRFHFADFLRSEWGDLASIDGEIGSHFDRQLEGVDEYGRDFGTQRYQVWIEIFDGERDLIPKTRLKSPGPERVGEPGAGFSGVSVRLPGAAGPASTVFGLTQVEPPDDAPPELLAELERRADGALLFTRATVLRDQAESLAGRTLSELAWQPADLASGLRWGSEVGPGDLFQVGGRWVVLYFDSGQPGVLDPRDLCFDFENGAAIRPLDRVFVGEGEVEWAPLHRLTQGAAP